jgi:hypothetical protein
MNKISWRKLEMFVFLVIFFATTMVAQVVGLGQEAVKASLRPHVGMEGLASSPYSRSTGSVELGHLRLTGGEVFSEGKLFTQATAGWKLSRGKPSSDHHHSRWGYIEPQVGVAKVRGEGGRALFGVRGMYESPKWFMETWTITTNPKKEGWWTNCEPLADVFRYVGKGFYVGVVSSCFVGPEPKHGKDSHPAAHHPPAPPATTPGTPRVRQFFAGAGVMRRQGKTDFGVSYELPLSGGRAYIALFGSFSF